jgi:hypothetical protein
VKNSARPLQSESITTRSVVVTKSTNMVVVTEPSATEPTATATKSAPTRYVLTVQPLPGVDAIRALRWGLKTLLRRYGLRCVDLSQQNEHDNSAGGLS